MSTVNIDERHAMTLDKSIQAGIEHGSLVFLEMLKDQILTFADEEKRAFDAGYYKSTTAPYWKGRLRAAIETADIKTSDDVTTMTIAAPYASNIEFGPAEGTQVRTKEELEDWANDKKVRLSYQNGTITVYSEPHPFVTPAIEALEQIIPNIIAASIEIHVQKGNL